MRTFFKAATKIPNLTVHSSNSFFIPNVKFTKNQLAECEDVFWTRHENRKSHRTFVYKFFMQNAKCTKGFLDRPNRTDAAPYPRPAIGRQLSRKSTATFLDPQKFLARGNSSARAIESSCDKHGFCVSTMNFCRGLRPARPTSPPRPLTY